MFPKEMSVERSSPSSSVLLPQEEKGASTGDRQALGRVRLFLRRNLSGYLFLLPALLIFALFVWYPIISGILMSFQSVDLINPSRWVGVANYQEVFRDPLFVIAWRNTLEFTLYALLFGYLVPIVLALLINEMRHG